jgi:hypothetical protein
MATKIYVAFFDVPEGEEAFDLFDEANLIMGEVPPDHRAETVEITNIGQAPEDGTATAGIMVNGTDRTPRLVTPLEEGLGVWNSSRLGIHPVTSLFAVTTSGPSPAFDPLTFGATTLLVEFAV